MKARNAVWITWEIQPRNRSMARGLGIPLYELCVSGPRLARYAKAVVSTLRLLLRERPSVIFAPNPSLVLTYLLLAYRALRGVSLTIDAHYGGVVSVTNNRWVQRLLDFANRRADLVIVTNETHAERVRRAGGSAFVCPDPLPQLRSNSDRPSLLATAAKSVLFICSYDCDEPYEAVFTAARMLTDSGFRVFVSGSYSRVGLSPSAVPHVTLLGYVDRAAYEAYLRHADIVLDLTNWQDCLVCGAYEAMAARKPCVLSRTTSLTRLFSAGTVFTSHEPEDIAQAITTAYERRFELSSQIEEWSARHEEALGERLSTLGRSVGLAHSGVCVSPSLVTSP